MIDGLGAFAASGTYLDQAKSASAQALDKSLDKDYSKATEEELMGACKEFEAYFLEQVFKALEKTAKVPGDEDDSSSTTKTLDMFKDQMYQEYASSAVETEGFGIAQMLYESMKSNNNIL